MTQTILRLPDVKRRVGLSRSSIYQRIKEGTFPRQVSLGSRAVGFNSDEIDAWIAERIEASNPDKNERLS